MPAFRVTLTINRIPWHDKYTSMRLTAFLFSGDVELMAKLKDKLYEQAEKALGYGEEEWWKSKKVKTFTYNAEVVEVSMKESKGLGFYYADVAYEDDNGFPSKKAKIDLHKKRFGYEFYSI